MEFRAFITAVTIATAALTATWLATPALAEDGGLPYATEAEQSVRPEFSQPVGEEPPADAAAAEEGVWVPPKGYDTPLKPALSARFGLEEKERVRKYLNGLCALEPVAVEESRRAYVNGRSRYLLTPSNKQGSLRLLLENYTDALAAEAACEAKRARDTTACRAPTVRWHGSHAAWKAWGASPGADLLAQQKLHRERAQSALASGFHELRDAAQLNGKAESLARAKKILAALRDESTCGTRAVETFR